MTSNIMLTLLYFIVVLAVYYILPKRLRGYLLLAASLLFYACADVRLLILAVACAAWSYLTGWLTGHRENKKFWFLAGIIPVTGVLFIYKYFDFFAEQMSALLATLGLGGGLPVLSLVMPLGISYYTFKMISYNADIFLGRREPEEGAQGAAAYLTYVLFFPQILSGPIERSEGFLKKWHEGAVYDAPLFSSGIQLIVLGLFKKMVIANRLSAYVDTIYDAPGSYPGLALVMAAVFYSFQIYCDFSGYSDIAFGMARLLGYESISNFNCPYFARGIKEFWSRWHISLSSWLRDYIYIPLGGNRVTRFRHGINIIITFLVSGLWHGASWTFVFWGLLHGLWNLIAGKKKEGGALRKIRQTLVTFAGVTFCWIFFRAESLSAAVSYIRMAVAGFSLSYASVQAAVLPFTGDNTCVAYLLTVCLFLLALFIYEFRRVYGKRAKFGASGNARAEAAYKGCGPVLSLPWLVFMTLSVVMFGVFGSSGFLYAGF